MKIWKVYDNANENDNDGQRIYFDPEKLTWAFGSSELKSFRLNKKHQGTWDIIVVISNCCGLRFLSFWSINVKTDGCRIMVIREVHARWAKIHVLFLAFHVSIPENPIKELFWFRLQKWRVPIFMAFHRNKASYLTWDIYRCKTEAARFQRETLSNKKPYHQRQIKI